MLIKKAQTDGSYTAAEQDIALINQYALTPLKPEDLFVFRVKLCDNAVDRDCECFPRETLQQLSELYVGKPGIFDHCWSASGQTARIFRTEVVDDGSVGSNPATGEPYAYLRGYAYIVRTAGTEETIRQIEGGILKEVSVGCRCQEEICSICGNPLFDTSCAHRRGQEYDGKTCVGLLKNAADAFEWSFVPVPAQPKAGTTKTYVPTGEPPAENNALADMENMLNLEKLRR